MEFVDTHTHCTDEAFSPQDTEDFISRAVGKGVKTMLLADVSSRERSAMFACAKAHPLHLRAMLGLYPGSVDGNWKDEIDALQDWVSEDIVAIGEIGLDYHWSKEFAAEQKEVLMIQLELASKMNLPVNIHLRDATEDFFEVLDECRGLSLRGDMHAFSGSYETFLRLQKYGDWRVGIGGVVTFRNASLAEVVKKVPLERILLETDAPYLSPVPLRGTRNESANIPIIAEKIAELKGISVEEVAETTTHSAKELFDL